MRDADREIARIEQLKSEADSIQPVPAGRIAGARIQVVQVYLFFEEEGMGIKKSEVEIDADAGEITLEVAATYASVGAWWIFKKDVDADSYETLGKGQSERRTKFAIIESAEELIGDTVSVLVIASSLKSGESMAGASLKVFQGDEMLAELDDQARVEGSHRFEFEIQLQEG